MFVQLLADMAETGASPALRAQFTGELNLSQYVLTTLFRPLESLAALHRAGVDDAPLRRGARLGVVRVARLDARARLGHPAGQGPRRLTWLWRRWRFRCSSTRRWRRAWGAIEWGLAWSALLGLLLLGRGLCGLGRVCVVADEQSDCRGHWELRGDSALRFPVGDARPQQQPKLGRSDSGFSRSRIGRAASTRELSAARMPCILSSSRCCSSSPRPEPSKRAAGNGRGKV
jgi:hypothetical protein